jgi:hypothetical protein
MKASPLAHLPIGASVRYQDPTVHPRKASRQGTVCEHRTSTQGTPFLRVRLRYSMLDTIPENLTLAHHSPNLINP